MTVEQFDPKTTIKSSNSAESQTTTLDIPSKMIEEQK
jgi:ribosomal protein S12 methylthiotransferase